MLMKTAINQDYTVTTKVAASSKTIFLALTDIEQIKQWWENPVTGSAQEGGELRFGFVESDDFTLMYVDIAEPHVVQWTVLDDTGYGGEWIGTKTVFEINSISASESALTFTHIGLHPGLISYDDCVKGWNRFLLNIQSLSESLEKVSNVSG
jgi:uncharacterized protein YndB with AHSA1/START domain